jgi:hypothetical protein
MSRKDPTVRIRKEEGGSTALDLAGNLMKAESSGVDWTDERASVVWTCPKRTARQSLMNLRRNPFCVEREDEGLMVWEVLLNNVLKVLLLNVREVL